MEPEIARRCPSCGASVRGAAHFCPQCGGPMEAAAQKVTADQSALVEDAERVASSLEGRLAAGARDEEAARAEIGARVDRSRDDNGARRVSDGRGESQTLTTQAATTQPTSAQPATARPATSQAAADQSPTVSAASSAARQTDAAQSSGASQISEAGARRSRDVRTSDEGAAGGVHARAAAVGAGVGESLRPRVERLRERSVVVFDEAADDPGLRFVLVAALLFFVALLLYVFSFVLR